LGVRERQLAASWHWHHVHHDSAWTHMDVCER
jgi:hypothetical protein